MSISYSDSDDDGSGVSSYDEDLAIEAKRALAYLQTTRNYRYIEFLAQGGYGWVALVYDDDKNRSLAVKCTSDTSEMELSWWPLLDHPNILPLLEHITMDTCTVFIMPAMRKDLWMLLNEPRFYCEELSFGLCRVWLKDVASALAYLHGQFLCHLDLKLDNVFLKMDGYACLGDFSLLSDIREVPAGFHFLEIYEPPEYTKWCHGAPPEAIASATVFGGDKADMWQFGILALDLLSNLKVSSSKSTNLTLFHHDIWPVLQKIILHEEYLSFLLEETFLNVVFSNEDFSLCHDFIKNILILEPDARMSAEQARYHAFTNTEWPQLPKEFTLPEVVEEYLPKPLPLPKEELKDPTLTVDEVIAAADEKEREEPGTSTGAPDCLDVMKRKMKKMKKEKMVRRESIFEEAGKKLVEIKPAPAVLQRKATPWIQGNLLQDNKDDQSEVKVTTHKAKLPSGKMHPIKVTAVKLKNAVRKSKDAKKKSADHKS